MQPNLRWNSHVAETRNYSDEMLIHRAMRKYGIENFQMTILEQGTYLNVDQIHERECYWIDTLKSNDLDFGYNIGQSKRGAGILTEETKRKLSEARKQY